MKTEIDGTIYKVERRPSVFTNRNGLEDVVISCVDTWGARDADGLLYRTVVRLAAEDGSVLRSASYLPKEFSHEWLTGAGMLDAIERVGLT